MIDIKNVERWIFISDTICKLKKFNLGTFTILVFLMNYKNPFYIKNKKQHFCLNNFCLIIIQNDSPIEIAERQGPTFSSIFNSKVYSSITYLICSYFMLKIDFFYMYMYMHFDKFGVRSC